MTPNDALNVDASGPSRSPADKELKRRLFLKAAEKYYAKVLAVGDRRTIKIWENAISHAVDQGDFMFLFALMTAKTVPVTFDEFVESKEFFADQMEVWPTLMPSLRKVNADVLAGEEPVHELYMGGATGTGKTLRAHVTTAYQVYCLTCFREVQRIFKKTPATPLVFLLQSPSTLITKRVIYTPFRNMFLAMPYAKKYLDHDKRKDSSLDLSGNIQIVPALAGVESMLGQAVPGGIFDEINFMSIVENSKQVPGASGKGGYYDQAQIVHSNVTRRRKRSMPQKGPSLGVLCFSSSTRYKGDFLDRRIEEAEENCEKFIHIVRDKQYEANPEMRATPLSDRFRFLVGTDTYAGRVLKDFERPGTHYPENAQIELIPNYYLQDFRRNPEEASRDVIGAASLSITPFIAQRGKIVDAIVRGRENGIRNWVAKADVDLLEDGMPQWDEETLAALSEEVKAREWYIHVDLSKNHDRCGIGGVSISGHKDMLVGSGDDAFVERLPVFATGFTVSIKPSPMREIDIPAVRNFILQLKTYYGINVVAVTFDGFNSAESMTFFRSVGIYSGHVSVDAPMEAYIYLRDVFYTDRIDLTDHELLKLELIQLEHVVKKNKVDHPPRGSKDISDGLCGSVFAASQARANRVLFGVKTADGQPGHTAIPRLRPRAYERPKSIARPKTITRPATALPDSDATVIREIDE